MDFDDHTPSTFSGIVQKVIITVVGAGIVGAGTVLLTTSREVAVHDYRLENLEKKLSKIDEIDRNVSALNGKVDVMNQKLDDAKGALEHERVR